MAYEKTPKLCVGTFFSLITEIKKGGLSKKERREGKTYNFSDPRIMEALFGIFSYQLPFAAEATKSNDTSKIRNCKKDKTEWLPINDPIFTKAIKDEFENDYYTLLAKTNTFVNNNLDVRNEIRFKKIFKAILETIVEDVSIPADSLFVVGANKKAIKKSELTNEVKYSYQAFLLGVWYYILTNGIKNTDGKATIEDWFFSDSPHDPNKLFTGEIGDGKSVAKVAFLFLSDNDDQFKAKTEQEQEQLLVEKDYSSYINTLKDKYSSVMTILYEQPQPFRRIFVCSSLSCNIYAQYANSLDFHFTHKIMKNATVEKLLSFISNRILLQGSGGLGKSMMMRHLLLQACDDYSRTKMLPFFINLRTYNEEEDLTLFIYNSTLHLHNMSFEDFKKILVSGKAIILFDGMDEIQFNKQANFELALEKFTDRYSGNVFILSTRRYKKFDALSRFIFLSLLPLELEQAVELINKLEFDEEKKNEFLKQLKTKLYKSHKDFASNPLLLNILLLTFDTNADIPIKMHEFYSKAYEALSTRHDSNKGGFIREYRTHLRPDRFKDFFTRFCAISYFNEQYEFSREEYNILFEETKKQVAEPHEMFTATEFLEDLTSSVCVIYYEDNKYRFVHRSFQEYFTACFLCRVDNNSYYPEVCDFFNSSRKTLAGDSTFDMFYDMNKKAIEEYLFLPYLESIFNPIDGSEDNFTYFVKRMYPVIMIPVGDSANGESDDYTSLPSEYVYRFVKKTLGLDEVPNLFDIPIDSAFVEETYCLIQEGSFGFAKNISTIYTLDEGRAYLEKDGRDPESAVESGWDIKININYLLDNKNSYEEVYNFLFKPDGELREEYNRIFEYYEKLKVEKKEKGKKEGIKKLFN